MVTTEHKKLIGQKQDRPFNGKYPRPLLSPTRFNFLFPNIQQSHQMVGQHSHALALPTLLNIVLAPQLLKWGPSGQVEVKKHMTSGFVNSSLACCCLQSPYSAPLKHVRLSDCMTEHLSVWKKCIQRAQSLLLHNSAVSVLNNALESLSFWTDISEIVNRKGLGYLENNIYFLSNG